MRCVFQFTCMILPRQCSVTIAHTKMKKKKDIKYDDAEHNDHDYHDCHYYTDYVDNTYHYDKKNGAEKN